RPDVQIQAVLARRGRVGKIDRDVQTSHALRLHADVAERVRVADTGPLRHWLRRTPPQLADGRGCERNALEHANARRRCGRAGEQAGVSLDRLWYDRAETAHEHRGGGEHDTCCCDPADLNSASVLGQDSNEASPQTAE